MNRRVKLKELVKEMEGHADDARLYYAVDITAGDLRSWLEAIPESYAERWTEPAQLSELMEALRPGHPARLEYEGMKANMGWERLTGDWNRRRFIRQAAIALASAPFHYHLGNGEFQIANRCPQDAVRDAIALWDELQKAGV